MSDDEQKLRIPIKEEKSDDSQIKTVSNLLSKRQQKRLIKLEKWEEIRKIKRLKEREKYKKKRQEAFEKGLPTRTGPSRKELKKYKSNQNENSIKIVIDLDYDDLMIDKDISKCVKQLLRIYTINRRSKSPCHLHFTGIKTNGRIHETLKKNDGYENWDVKWHFDKSYCDVFQKSEIIYLSSESDQILEKLDKNDVFVIGGLVDHNHHKGLSYKRADEQQLRTARLPLNEYVDMKTRTVLSTYHVFEILIRLSEGNCWSDSILKTIPIRKGARLKNKNVTEIAEDNVQNQNETVLE